MTHEENEKVEVSITLAVLHDGRRYYAVAPHLRIVGYGNSSEEALEDFDKAAKCFIRFHLRNKNLKAKLLNLGWKLDNSTPVTPKEWTVPTHMFENSHIHSTQTKQLAFA